MARHNNKKKFGVCEFRFDAANIKAYLREEWDCAAFDDANTGRQVRRESNGGKE